MVGMTVLAPEQEARKWRDEELQRTDIAAMVSDYPNAEAILVYRQALRGWPETEDFPENRPTLSAPAEELAAIAWRDGELETTDFIMSEMDHPDREAYLTYRTQLIHWPEHEGFPDIRPVLGA
jgi:hypothetical protein